MPMMLSLALCLVSHAHTMLPGASCLGCEGAHQLLPKRSIVEGRRALVAAAVLAAVSTPALALDVLDSRTRSLMDALGGQPEATVESSPLIEELKRRTAENKAKNEALVRQQTQVTRHALELFLSSDSFCS